MTAEKLAAGAVDAQAIAAVTAKVGTLTADSIKTDQLAAALAALPELAVRGADWDEGTGTLTVRLHWRGTDLGLTVPVA